VQCNRNHLNVAKLQKALSIQGKYTITIMQFVSKYRAKALPADINELIAATAIKTAEGVTICHRVRLHLLGSTGQRGRCSRLQQRGVEESWAGGGGGEAGAFSPAHLHPHPHQHPHTISPQLDRSSPQSPEHLGPLAALAARFARPSRLAQSCRWMCVRHPQENAHNRAQQPGPSAGASNNGYISLAEANGRAKAARAAAEGNAGASEG